MQTVSFSFFRYGGIGARAWAFGMMGFARPMMRQIPDLQFWKLCGSGVGEGFTPIPNTAVYAVLATWPDRATAEARIAAYKPFTLFRDRAVENLTVYLEATSARGQWSGVAPFQPEGKLGDGPVAALTRATVKPAVAAQFWRRVPDISAIVGKDPNVRFKIGVGELPGHAAILLVQPIVSARRGDGQDREGRRLRVGHAEETRRSSEVLHAVFRLSRLLHQRHRAECLEHAAEQDRPPLHLAAEFLCQRVDLFARQIGIGRGEIEIEQDGLAHVTRS